jgi:hypothetical protein
MNEHISLSCWLCYALNQAASETAEDFTRNPGRRPLEGTNSQVSRPLDFFRFTEMRFLRHVAGYTRRDEISNLTIHSELQIFNRQNDKITDKKKEWHDHIQRMDPYRIARKAVEYRPSRHRDVGRPKRSWEDDF